MKNPVFTGAGVAIITPMYEDGSINFDELGRIVEDQIARGTDAIVICGTTGECSTMTDEEQLAAMRAEIRAMRADLDALRAENTKLRREQEIARGMLADLMRNASTPPHGLYTPEDVRAAKASGFVHAAKLYPANATTNSSHGVTSIDAIMPVLERMQKLGMPLLVHGEVTHAEIDIFDREARFIETVMEPLRQRLPALKVVFEHITTKDAAEYVRDGNDLIAETITPQHLMFNRNHMLVGGVRPHLYCLPILKRNIHQQALRELVASGFSRAFLGTDSAPHARHRKEASCGCAGCFNAPTALASYATVFEEMNALEHFEAFCSLNGPRFYGLPVNDTFIELERKASHVEESIALTDDTLIPFLAGETVNWTVKR